MERGKKERKEIRQRRGERKIDRQTDRQTEIERDRQIEIIMFNGTGEEGWSGE